MGLGSGGLRFRVVEYAPLNGDYKGSINTGAIIIRIELLWGSIMVAVGVRGFDLWKQKFGFRGLF